MAGGFGAVGDVVVMVVGVSVMVDILVMGILVSWGWVF